MADRILVFYGSYRVDRMGIRLADFIVGGLRDRGADVELIDAKAVGLPMLDRMYKEHRQEEHTPELQSLMRISYAVFCLKKQKKHIKSKNHPNTDLEHTQSIM